MGKAEILHQIKDAEDQVRKMSREAEEKRKQLQAEGKRLAIQKVDAAEAALRKQIDAKVAEVQRQIEGRKKALLEEGAKKAAAITLTAKGRMAETKAFVISEFERAVDA